MANRSGDSASVTPSRTQRKREALDLQRLGQRLVELDPGDLARIPLTVEIGDAIQTWKRIRSFEAQRRQLQFLGKLMRQTDVAPIVAALERIDGNSADARFAFHQLETWRERLISEPEALTEYLSSHPQADRQQLRQQIGRVGKAKDDSQRKREARSLFRLLKAFEEDAPEGS